MTHWDRQTWTRSVSIVVLVFGLFGAAGASAFQVEYGAARPAGLRACDSLRYHGEAAKADACYAALLQHGGDALVLAEAARALGDLQAANVHFRAARKANPDDPQVRTRWGWLFLEAHQADEAVQLFLEALDLDPDYVPAKLGLATVAAQRFQGKARQWVKEVLATDTGNVEVRLIQARMELEEGNIQQADTTLEEALRLVQQRDLPPLEVYALLASSDLLRGVRPSPWAARALAYNPNYGQIYATEAYFYVITRRYREAIALLRRGLELQPGLTSARTRLGVNLLRENKVDAAKQQLALAYRSDPYDPVTINTLRLIDSFDHFVVHRDVPDDKAAPVIITRLHQDEDKVLRPYVLSLARRAIKTYTQAFGFVLKEPVVIEMYPNPDDFAVRISGLPGIGLLGVTFGYLVAMDSPSAGKSGSFNWGTTLWHELAHVFTLEMTHHLVPRWFSEGVSVYEEWSTGPLQGRHLPPRWFEAVKAHRLLPVAKLDQGFIRPTYKGQINVSYMQAGLICQYIHAQWGPQGIRDMLEAYADGLDTSAAIQRSLGMSTQDFDQRFVAFVKAGFAGAAGQIDAWRKQLREANKAVTDKDWDRALNEARQTIRLMPAYVDAGSGYLVAAQAEHALGQDAARLASLNEYRRLGGYDPAALRALAGLLYQDGKHDQAIDVLQDVLFVTPLDGGLHQQLGDWLMTAGRSREALAEYQAYAATNPHDQAGVHYRLASAWLELGNHERGRKQLLKALSIAPHYRAAQQLLLEMVRDH